MFCSYSITEIHKNALIITACDFTEITELVIKTSFSFQQCSYANILNMA